MCKLVLIELSLHPPSFFGGLGELGNEAGSLFVSLGGLNSQRCASLSFPRAGQEGVTPALSPLLVGFQDSWPMLFTRGSS